ncbi:RRPp/PMC2 like exosome exoribonuclease subunit with an RNAseD domain and an HRDc domain [Cryptosporidium ryanae]|uniref:RRPp/PMC2 like exosome exoribonuclease subunit with an RNAseD domain and an HRDc domain n=1 Tax=Cryptosporidium ryanae TaxID=515981 RepID=UPI00351A8C8F|nr:RRPp/PMC2 like exosome exoribonuclease subunit with an RNAseD domain and an HRDc domain [Cryptosporidium ryanae]
MDSDIRSFGEGDVNAGDMPYSDVKGEEKCQFMDLKARGFFGVDMKGECDVCRKMENKFRLLLSENEKSLMVQSNWRDLIDNFSIVFVPRLISTPNKTQEDVESDVVIAELLRYNQLRTSNGFKIISEYRHVEAESRGYSVNNKKHSNVIGLLHPRHYSTNIDYLSENNSENTGILLIDELSRILHDKELVMCQKYVLFNYKYFTNVYEKELRSLVWAINGTVYHAGGDECNITDIKEAKSYFNFSYSSPRLPLPLNTTPLIFVNDVEGLKQVIREILDYMEMHYRVSEDNSPFILSIDLEHHSTQTYKGFVSLIQMSTRKKDYIIDPFCVFHELVMLNELTTNPRILKVLHGSDFDIFWLQRDFSVYIVNMFDTGKAAKLLNTPGGYSLKNLMEVYCNIDMDKTHQLSDWRERPLSEEKIKYARSDTHYLPYIYDILKNLLLLHSHIKSGFLLSTSDAMMEIDHTNILLEKENSTKFNINFKCIDSYMALDISDLDPSPLLTALHNSRQVSAKTYFTKPVDIWAKLHSIKGKLLRSCMNSQLDRVLCLTIGYFLLLWREGLAKLLDLTPSYILKDLMIVKISSKQPTNEVEIFELFNPVPVNVKRHSEAILGIVNTVKSNIVSKSEEAIFELNSVISHILSNVSEGLSKSNERGEDMGAIPPCPGKSVVECKQIGDLESKTVDKNLSICSDSKESFTPTFEKRAKRIKIRISTDSVDDFADNLFGQPFSKRDSIVSDETLISNRIINDINKSMYKGNSSSLISRFPDTRKGEDSVSDKITEESDCPRDKVDTGVFTKVEGAESDVDNIDVSIDDDKVMISRKSLKEEYDNDSDYLDRIKGRKRRKKSDDEQKEKSSSQMLFVSENNLTEKFLEKHKISEIHEKVKGLPASFVCDEQIPDFIKKVDSSSPARAKKFISSKKTKKRHKK